MSRVHNSLPLKSKPLRMPVPVITKTLLPSVTGEGDDMFCLRILTLPLPSSFFQATSPLAPIDAPKIEIVAVGDVQKNAIAAR